ncbi:lysozyme inhibitor LprI family protein [Butyrivibrio sp. MC2013]|uniref:lysozyme inhibitor LprI family protein n=1 Tax=Butyrivibrio sp. MC2013 TaxID=1280686 RepID=UPI00042918DC|nr:lysozyme inhibitor LprI family protein [Butyrivibrio sp. MC2013]
MKNTTVRKLLASMLIASLSVSTLSACSGTAANNKDAASDQEASKAEDAADQSADSSDADQEAADGTASDSSESASEAAVSDTSPDNAVGEWEYVYTLHHSEYGTEGESYDSCYMADDPYGTESEIHISKDGDDYLADYKYSEYETNDRFYGAKMLLNQAPAADFCDNKDWYMEFDNPFNDDYTSRRFTLIDGDTLVSVFENKEGEKGTEDYFYYYNTDYYLRKGSERLKDREGLRYFKTVTVSTIEDLVNSLDNNTKIILKAGTYDFTLLDQSKENSEFLKTRDELEDTYRTYTIQGLSNCCIEAEEGAEVFIYTDEAYDPVMYFSSATNVTLRGLTIGHNVEPGYCSGSVVGFEYSNGITIDKCNLFGCGTYGIEGNSIENLTVTDSDIYECTYGLLSFDGLYTANFDRCTFRDSKDMSLLEIYSGYEINFNDCEFKNNYVDSGYDFLYFVNLGEYAEVSFNKCSFEGNQYDRFSNRKVKLIDCTMNDNGDPDLSNVAVSEEDYESGDVTYDSLHTAYDEALKRQKEIDDTLAGDSLLDQQSLNDLASEEYELWDDLLNKIWGFLSMSLDEDTMASLTAEQKKWISEKESAAKEAASGFEGGSAEPMVRNGKAAELTRSRVEYLIENYLP